MLLGFVLVALDFYLSSLRISLVVRGAMLVPVVWWMAERNRWCLSSLGVRLRPQQSVRYWAGRMAAIGVAVGTICAVFLVLQPDLWRNLAFRGAYYSREVGSHLFFSCFGAPIIEEAIYRFALCNLMLLLVGPWKTALLDGLIFAALHAVYGKLGPDNAVAGFFFAWAFIKSRSIVVPILLHATGNFVVFIVELAAAKQRGLI